MEQSLNGSAQVICATGFRRGFRHDPLLARLVAEHDLETADGWLVLEPDSTVPALSDADADTRGRGRTGAVGVPGRGHARRRAVRRPPLPGEDQVVSYTLRGRVETRLAALLPVLLGACVLAGVLHRWWPVELVALMAAVGLFLDLEVWHRLLPYQPAWATRPAGRGRARRADGDRLRLRPARAAPARARALRRGLARCARPRPGRAPAAAPRLRGGRRRARPGGRRRRCRPRPRVRRLGRDLRRPAPAGRPPERRRPPGAARDRRGARYCRASRAPSFAAASSSPTTTFRSATSRSSAARTGSPSTAFAGR